MIRGTTSLSWRSTLRSGSRRRRALAWTSLSLALVASPGCLITSAPEFERPKQTPPFLIAADAKPDLRQPIIVTDVGQPAITFDATVLSEDHEPVQVRLLIDYGFTNVRGQKARRVIPQKQVAAGSLSDGPRPLSAAWFPSSDPVDRNGCHTVTLMVSHRFDDNDNNTGCPVRRCDSSALVWQVLLPCEPGEDCITTCEPAPDTCPPVAEGASVPAELTCPGDDADAGAP